MGEVLYLLTGEIHSGKTTRLLSWCQNRKDVVGILSPVIGGARTFLDIGTMEEFPMEVAGEEETMDIGKYHFSKAAFDRASSILFNNIHTENWLVIDEIGPLELRGEGFAAIVKKITEERVGKTLFVVRDIVLPDVIGHFKLDRFGPEIIRVNDEGPL